MAYVNLPLFLLLMALVLCFVVWVLSRWGQ
jgi:hypothetical protein